MTTTSLRPALVIADLHGNLAALEGNLRGANAIDRYGHWAKPGCDLIFLGDVVADRGKDDIELVRFVNHYRDQVTMMGGTCVTLAGNHDMMGFSFLAGDERTRKRGDQSMFAGRVYSGSNFAQYFHGLTALAAVHPSCPKTDDLGTILQWRASMPTEQFLAGFYMTDAGRKVLRYFLNLRLFEVRGDTLFMHTPLTPENIQYLLKRTPEADLNAKFRAHVELELRKGQLNPESKDLQLVQGFTHSDNRHHLTYRISNLKLQAMKETGVNRVVCGHDTVKSLYEAKLGPLDWIILDTGYGRESKIENKANTSECGAAWVYPNGKVEGFDYPLPGEGAFTYKSL